MTMRSWTRCLLARPATRTIRKRPHRARLALEALEDRTVLSTFTVTNTNDSGAGSLRDAITQAQSAANLGVADTIVFNNDSSLGTNFYDSTPHTITLTGGPLTLTDTATTTINGPGANLLSISGNNQSGVFAINSGASAALSGLTITGGMASFGAGVDNHGTLALNGCTVKENYGSTGGGGIDNEDGATLTVTGSTFSQNYGATYGGGGLLNGLGTVILTNSTFSGNTSFAGGGGIDTHGTLTATNCTLSGNAVIAPDNYGGGILTTGTTTLRNTIVSGNLSSGGTPDDINGGVDSSSSYNLIGTGGSGGLVDGVNNNLVGRDPLLAPLGYYGGPTQTMALLPGSPAIDAGSNAHLVPTSEVQAVTTQAPTSEVQAVTPRGPTSEVQSFGVLFVLGTGTFSLTFRNQPTAEIAYQASAAQVQAALNGLSSIGGVGGSVTVDQSGTGYTVTFGGSLANQDLPQLTLSVSGSGLGSVDTVTQGGTGAFTLAYGGQPTALLAPDASAGDVETALNALPTIGGVGGSVTVTQSGATYTVTFGGSLANQDLPQITGSVGTIVSTVTQGATGQFTLTYGGQPTGLLQ
jgi:hypothetical protein